MVAIRIYNVWTGIVRIKKYASIQLQNPTSANQACPRMHWPFLRLALANFLVSEWVGDKKRKLTFPITSSILASEPDPERKRVPHLCSCFLHKLMCTVWPCAWNGEMRGRTMEIIGLEGMGSSHRSRLHVGALDNVSSHIAFLHLRVRVRNEK